MDTLHAVTEGPPASHQAREAQERPRHRAAIEAHGRWMATNGSEGARAELPGAVLRGADLSGVDLRGADLSGVDLRDADLSGARLAGADLRRADLRNALVAGASFRDARMAEADLSQVRGLLVGQLGGADLTAARLPDALAKFEGLASVAEVSKSSQGIFASMLLVCVYAWLTIASTTDAQLLNNAATASSRLPILGVDIPLVRFYVAAPLLLSCLYLYFHLGLQRLWEELAELPAVFPDGRTLDKKAAPWLLNSLINGQFPRLRDNRPQLTRWQARISVLLAWGAVPLTLLLLWARYLRAHDWVVTSEHVALLALAIGVGVGLFRLAGSTLRGAERRPFAWKRAWRDARGSSTLAGLAAGAALGFVSIGSIWGVNPELDLRGVRVPQPEGLRAFDPRFLVPRVAVALGFVPFAELDNGDLSLKPANWRGARAIDQKTYDQELGQVKGADLGGRNLRYAKAYAAFFANAYLRRSDLRGSDLREADLRGADLRDSRLERANLRSAILHGADLRQARLSTARLNQAQLQGANLEAADLRRAELVRAVLGPLALDEPRTTTLVNARLAGADLSEADLSEADLQGADLRAAKLEKARLDGTDLRGADLRDAVGLTPQQLLAARVDATTRLPETFGAVALSGDRPR